MNQSEAMRGRPEDVDLSLLLGVVRRQWRLVAGMVVAGLAVTVALVMLPGRQYEASITLALTGTPAAGASYASAVRTVLASSAVIAGVNQALAAEGLRADLDRDGILVDPVTNTHFVRLRVRLDEPRAAARAAALLGNRASGIARDLRDKALVSAGTAQELDLQQAKEKLDATEQSLMEFRRKTQIEVLREEVQSQLAQRRKAGTIVADIEVERARHAAAVGELERLRESPGGLEVNRIVAESLARVVAESRTTLAALEHAQKLNGPQRPASRLDVLQELYRLELEQSRLERALRVAEGVYAAQMARAAQVQLGQGVPLVEVVESTVPDGAPVPREIWRKVALGGILSLLLGVGLTVVREAARAPEPQPAVAAQRN